jgi:uncharacterized protein YqjF (DUF2071 family)
MAARPLLTAHWSELLLLNWAVPTEDVAPLVPAGTEPDLHDGQAYISIVGFRFHTCRLLGIPVPGHTSFPEINLRFYVRRHAGNEQRRGVVFVREIVPRRAVAVIANWLYNENYVTRPMRINLKMTGTSLAHGDAIEYAWRSACSWPLRGRPHRGQQQNDWNRLAARVAAPLAIPAQNSLDEFLVEHYWGYVRGRDGITREYRVVHDPWQVAPADSVTWDCDVPLTYNAPLAKHLSSPPTTALIAAGSPIQLYRGQRIP